MKIDLFQIGNFHVRGYGFMIGLGFLLALVLGCIMKTRSYVCLSMADLVLLPLR